MSRELDRRHTMIDTWTEMESCRAGQRLHYHRVRIPEYFTEF